MRPSVCPYLLALSTVAVLTAVAVLPSAAPAATPATDPAGNVAAATTSVPDAASKEKLRPAYLGVTTRAATEAQATRLNLAPGTGLYVELIDDAGPAAAAGVRRGDILTRLDDQALLNPEHLASLVQAHKPGDKAALELVRGTRTLMAADVNLREMPLAPAAGAVPGAAIPVAGGARAVVPAAGAVPGAAVPVVPNPPVSLLIPAPGANITAVSTVSDGEHQLTLKTVNGRRTLLATDAAGTILFSGPVNTAADLNGLPSEIMRKLEPMIASSGTRASIVLGTNGAGNSLVFAPGIVQPNIGVVRQPNIGGAGNNAALGRLLGARGRSLAATETYFDGEHQLSLGGPRGAKYLVATDAGGKVIFEGPTDTEPQRASLPPAIRKKLEALEDRIKEERRGDITMTQGDVTVTMTVEGSHQSLVAKDTDGKVLFQGPIDTEAQREKMPDRVRVCLEKLWKTCQLVVAPPAE